MFRGEFISLNCGTDFYGTTVDELYQEGRTSLRVFLQTLKAEGIEPYRNFSGKLNVRLGPALRHEAVLRAEAEGLSLNEFLVRVRQPVDPGVRSGRRKRNRPGAAAQSGPEGVHRGAHPSSTYAEGAKFKPER
jgi:predicted HicB family RNase H-like nuclease